MNNVQSKAYPITQGLSRFWTSHEFELFAKCKAKGPVPVVHIPTDQLVAAQRQRIADAISLFEQAALEWDAVPTERDERSLFGMLRLFQSNVRNSIKILHRSIGEANPAPAIKAFYATPGYVAYKRIADPLWKGSKRYKTQHAEHERNRYGEDDDYAQYKKDYAKAWDATKEGKAARKRNRARPEQKRRKARNLRTFRARVKGDALIADLRSACRYNPQAVEGLRKEALSATIKWLMLKGEDAQKATVNAAQLIKQIIWEENGPAMEVAA